MVGIGVMFVFIAFMGLVTKKLFAYRASANQYTDARVNYMKEVLSNLKMIKFYSWETPYFARITDNRTKEMRIIYNMQMVRNVIVSVAMSLTLSRRWRLSWLCMPPRDRPKLQQISSRRFLSSTP